MFQSNYVYRIVDLDKIKEIATLKDVFTKEQHIISLKQLDANFRPYYALTGHSYQGVTTEKNINIYDLKSDFISSKWIWTALTRTTDLNKLNIVIATNNTKLTYDLNKMITSYKMQDINANRTFTDETFITKGDICNMFTKQKGTCIICKEVLNIEHIESDLNNLSIDRIDNCISHVKGNCQITCVHCNISKH
jgi:hypothetical protein